MKKYIKTMEEKIKNANITINSINICPFNESDPSIDCGKWSIQVCSKSRVSLLNTDTWTYTDNISLDAAIEIIKK